MSILCEHKYPACCKNHQKLITALCEKNSEVLLVLYRYIYIHIYIWIYIVHILLSWLIYSFIYQWKEDNLHLGPLYCHSWVLLRAILYHIFYKFSIYFRTQLDVWSC